MSAILALSISPDGIEHISVLQPGQSGRQKAIDLFRAITPTLDKFDQELKSLARNRRG